MCIVSKYLWMAVVFIILTMTGCATNQGLGSNNKPFNNITLRHDSTTKANSITGKPNIPCQSTGIPIGNNVLLTVNTSQMTVDSGSLSNFLHNAQIHSHSLPGTLYTQAQVLASVDGDGTLVADNYFGDLRTNQNAKLYFLSAHTKSVSLIEHLRKGGGVISAAVLSRHWIAWTDFLPNGMMVNIGILDRTNRHSWYVGSIKNDKNIIQKGLTDQLFIRGDLLYVYSLNHVYTYNIETRKWRTFYALPSNSSLRISGLQLISKGEVVQLTQANVLGESMVVWLDKNGTKVGRKYNLPKDVLYMTGSSGNKIIFYGISGATYFWSLGSHTINKISDVASWLSGAGDRYLAGWGYTSKTAGQLLDMRTKKHYDFNADSSLVTPTRLYWTKGNVMYWSILPN